jgi:hypothetical protein
MLVSLPFPWAILERSSGDPWAGPQPPQRLLPHRAAGTLDRFSAFEFALFRLRKQQAPVPGRDAKSAAQWLPAAGFCANLPGNKPETAILRQNIRVRRRKP